MRTLPLVLFASLACAASAADKPNILWITSEDNGPELGCYGDTYAVTPNIDALAGKVTALSALLVERSGLCTRANDDHFRHVRDQPGRTAHAQRT